MRSVVALLWLAGCGVQDLDVLSSEEGFDGGPPAPLDAGVFDGGPPAPLDAGVSVTPVTAQTMSLGDRHSCAIWDESLYCWGSNDHGQIGSSAAGAQVLDPKVVSGAQRWTYVEAGSQHTCAIDDASAVWCWGDNADGQVGSTDGPMQPEPVQVAGLVGVVELVAGFWHTCARTRSGQLYCWGANQEGQLGLDAPGDFDQSSRPVPTLVPLDGFSDIGAGQRTVCGVRDHALFCWGSNVNRQLGVDTGEPHRRYPTLVDDHEWLQVAPGQEHTCALDRGGALYCWGDNATFNLGNGSMAHASTPQHIADGPFVKVDTDTFHGVALDVAGRVVGWGRNIEGELGVDGSSAELPSPREIGAELGGDIVEVATGRFHTCLRRRDGTLFCTGDNQDGQLGTGSTERPYSFTQVQPPLQ